MLASPVPIYLGCAGLIVGSLGLGAQYMLSGSSVSATNTASDRPLFARSVEEASLPVAGWSSQGHGVAQYRPMVELLTTSARSTQSPAPAVTQPQGSAQPQTAQQAQQEPHVAPREIVRDVAQPQTRQSRRTRNQRNRDEPPANEAMASTEQADPRAARPQTRQERRAQREQERQERREQSRGQERQRNAAQGETDRRDGGSRRFERRSRDRDDEETVDIRSRSDRRRVERDDRPSRDGERRSVVREDIREPEPRIVRGPEQRDGGFSPFRLFGIFDR